MSTSLDDVLAHQNHGVPVATAKRFVLVVHGVFGSGRNWRSFARELSSRFPEDAVVTVDLRNHGLSGPRPAPHDLAACARDLDRLVERAGRAPDFVIGHSFGGKVVLEYALAAAQPPQATWVLDCPIGAPAEEGRAPLDSQVGRLISWLEQEPLPIGRRSEVTERLAEAGFQRGVATWMATNLIAEGEGFRWSFDPAGVREMLEHYWRRDFYPDLEADGRPGGLVHFVWGTASDRWTEDDLLRLRKLDGRNGITVQPLEGAGHWMHVDRPAELLELVARGL